MTDRPESCGACYYYEPSRPSVGECRRYPPHVGRSEVQDRDWCGEFTPRERPIGVRVSNVTMRFDTPADATGVKNG